MSILFLEEYVIFSKGIQLFTCVNHSPIGKICSDFHFIVMHFLAIANKISVSLVAYIERLMFEKFPSRHISGSAGNVIPWIPDNTSHIFCQKGSNLWQCQVECKKVPLLSRI